MNVRQITGVLRLKNMALIAVMLTMLVATAVIAYAANEITGETLYEYGETTLYYPAANSTETIHDNVNGAFEYSTDSTHYITGVRISCDIGDYVDYTLILKTGQTLTGHYQATQDYAAFVPTTMQSYGYLIDSGYKTEFVDHYLWDTPKMLLTWAVEKDMKTAYIVAFDNNRVGVHMNQFTGERMNTILLRFTDVGFSVSRQKNISTHQIKTIRGTTNGATITTYIQNVSQINHNLDDLEKDHDENEEHENDSILGNLLKGLGLDAITEWIGRIVTFITTIIGVLGMVIDIFIFIFIDNFFMVIVGYIAVTMAYSIWLANNQGYGMPIFEAFKIFINFQIAFFNAFLQFLTFVITLFYQVIQALVKWL